MKLAIITDQHFGARTGADYIHGYFKKFYDNTFFPYLEKNKIDTIIKSITHIHNRINLIFL
jgi:3',5'-cyclic AMP phosphodiesterase CpdA